MKALIVWNESTLNSKEIQRIQADFFYCFFNEKDLLIESNDHFFIEDLTDTQTISVRNSLKKNKITEVIFWAESFIDNKIVNFFTKQNIKFSTYQRT